jgi:hypothetical protein
MWLVLNQSITDVIWLVYIFYFRNDDILQGDFPDTYVNNIYKTVMTYQWIVDKCVNTSFYFFVDDDFDISGYYN